jgi:hypothetical protein
MPLAAIWHVNASLKTYRSLHIFSWLHQAKLLGNLHSPLLSAINAVENSVVCVAGLFGRAEQVLQLSSKS